MNAIVPIPPGASLPAALTPDLTRAPPSWRGRRRPRPRCYRSDFRIFEAWCRGGGVKALPASPETVAAFLAYDVETGTRPSTLGRRVRSATLTSSPAISSPRMTSLPRRAALAPDGPLSKFRSS